MLPLDHIRLARQKEDFHIRAWLPLLRRADAVEARRMVRGLRINELKMAGGHFVALPRLTQLVKAAATLVVK